MPATENDDPQFSGSENSTENGWEDIESEDDGAPLIVSLLDERTFGDAESMLRHCLEVHALDFVSIRRRLNLDLPGTVRLINFIRRCTKEGKLLPKFITIDDIQSDAYIKPVLEDDALIMALAGSQEYNGEYDEMRREENAGQDAKDAETKEALKGRIRQLSEELRLVRTQFKNYRLAVERVLDHRWEGGTAAGPVGDVRDDPESTWNVYAAGSEWNEGLPYSPLVTQADEILLEQQ